MNCRIKNGYIDWSGSRGRQSLFPVGIAFQFTDAENDQNYSKRERKDAEADQDIAECAAVFLIIHFSSVLLLTIAIIC